MLNYRCPKSRRDGIPINPQNCLRIEIAGPIAAGKTTLARMAQSYGLSGVFEDFTANPFLASFYKDPAKFACETEFAFLLQHYHQIKCANSAISSVCDFSFLLDLAYARLNLAGRRHSLFKSLCEDIINEIGAPQKIIYLECPPEIIMERIRNRARPFEQSLDIEYIIGLRRACEEAIGEMPWGCEIVRMASSAPFDGASVRLAFSQA